MKTNWTTYENYLQKVKKDYTSGLKTHYLSTLKKDNSLYKIPFIEMFSDLTDIIPVEYEATSIDNFHLLQDIESTNYKNHLIREIMTPTWDVLRYVSLKEYSKTLSKTLQVYQRGMPIKTAGRMRGNMEYLEDRWRVQIQPITFKYAYLQGASLGFTEATQAKIRDKYVKIRVRYDGKQYAMVNAIKTNYTISYA